MTRMTPAEYKTWLKKQKSQKARNKGNKPTEVDGYKFPSMLEAAVYGQIRMREKAGELQLEQVQDCLEINIPFLGRRWGCRPDFRCKALKEHNGHKPGETFWIEAKGHAHDRWKMTYIIWGLFGPGRKEIWKGSHERPSMTEILQPVFPKGIVAEGEECPLCGRT